MATKAPAKKKVVSKMKLSDQLEREIRRSYYPNQLQQALDEVLGIEINAEWISTQEGREVEGYTEEEATSILEKQATRKEKLLRRVVLIKKLIDKNA